MVQSRAESRRLRRSPWHPESTTRPRRGAKPLAALALLLAWAGAGAECWADINYKTDSIESAIITTQPPLTPGTCLMAGNAYNLALNIQMESGATGTLLGGASPGTGASSITYTSSKGNTIADGMYTPTSTASTSYTDTITATFSTELPGSFFSPSDTVTATANFCVMNNTSTGMLPTTSPSSLTGAGQYAVTVINPYNQAITIDGVSMADPTGSSDTNSFASYLSTSGGGILLAAHSSLTGVIGVTYPSSDDQDVHFLASGFRANGTLVHTSILTFEGAGPQSGTTTFAAVPEPSSLLLAVGGCALIASASLARRLRGAR